MRNRFLWSCLALMLYAAPGFAQFTLVTGTVTDSNGLPYSCATLTATLVNANGQQLYLSGQLYTPAPSPVKTGCPTDPQTSRTSGAYTITLADNTQIKCGNNATGAIVTCGTQTTWNFQANSTGTPPPLGTGPQFCLLNGQTISGASQVVNISGCPALGNASGATSVTNTIPTSCAAGALIFLSTFQEFLFCGTANSPVPIIGSILVNVQSAKLFTDGTVTNGSPTITSAGQANFLCPNAVYPCSTVTAGSDVGFKIFATNSCNGAQCDFTTEPGSSTILPSTQTKVGRIATVNSATSVTVDCAAPGNCVSPNASATNTGNAVVLYGSDSTAALNNAFSAAATSLAGCPEIKIPLGIYFYNLPIFATTPAATILCNNTLVHSLQAPGHYFGGGGIVISGEGGDVSILTPTPDFTNPGASTNCVGGATIDQTWHDWSVIGYGQNLLGAGAPCSSLVGMPSYLAYNMTFHGWAARGGGSTGVNFGNGFGRYSNIEVFGFGGGSSCVSNGPNLFVNMVCGAAGGTSGNGSMTFTGGISQTINSQFFGGNPSNTPQIEVQNTAIWISSNDTVVNSSINTSPSDDIKIDNGGIANIANMTNTSTGANSKGIELVAGAKLFLSGYHHTGSSLGASITNAGTIVDGGNNTFNGPITNTGSWLNEGPSANNTTVTAAKLVLSAGWGSTATVTALGGGNAPIQFTITNSGVGQAANPTITYTFPNPYPVSPFSCAATQTGGNNPSLAPYAASALSATGVTFTATGTPTVNDTEIMQITCVTP